MQRFRLKFICEQSKLAYLHVSLITATNVTPYLTSPLGHPRCSPSPLLESVTLLQQPDYISLSSLAWCNSQPQQV